MAGRGQSLDQAAGRSRRRAREISGSVAKAIDRRFPGSKAAYHQPSATVSTMVSREDQAPGARVAVAVMKTRRSSRTEGDPMAREKMPRGPVASTTCRAKTAPSALSRSKWSRKRRLKFQLPSAGEPLIEQDWDATRRDGATEQPIKTLPLDMPSGSVYIREKVVVS